MNNFKMGFLKADTGNITAVNFPQHKTSQESRDKTRLQIQQCTAASGWSDYAKEGNVCFTGYHKDTQAVITLVRETVASSTECF